MKIEPLYIDGAWSADSGAAPIEVVDPATEEVFARVAAAQASDIDAAVQAARRAFDGGPWPRMGAQARGKVLRAIAGRIRERAEELARLESRDNGKPLPEARWDIGDAAGCFDFYAAMAEERESAGPEQLAVPDARFSTRVVSEPVGVAGAIIPWNYPLLMAAWKVAPALAAGCTVVLKPSELTPMTALALAGIAHKCGLPPGVLNVVPGLGGEAGAAISSHPGVDKLAFTGSLATGSRVMQAAARDIRRVSLELGGKSPFVVFADSELGQAIEWIMFGIFWNQGQVCSATSRVLVERPLFERLVARLAAEAARIRMGNGLHDGVLLGPLVSRGQLEKVQGFVRRARDAGAHIHGGDIPLPGRGYFHAPTVITGMALDSECWREEIFGPVVCVAPFDTEEQAVALANDSRYGLAAAVMSGDDARCERVASALRAGIIWINCSQPTFTDAPWGGYKQSGIGRELGRWGFENYLETKQVTRYETRDAWGWYLKG